MTRNRMYLEGMCLISLIAALGVDPCSAGAPAVPTNFEIVDRVSSDVAKDIIATIGVLQKDESLILTKAKSAGAVDFMLENAMVREMRNAGIGIALESAKKDTSVAQAGKYRLSYQIIRLSLSYPRIGRKWWFGPREVSRSAQVDVFAQLIEIATGNVVWVKESHKEYRDTIDYSLLKEVEDSQYDFTRPPHNEFRMIRLLEPVVVGGIVAGLVYLFFSNQSD